MVIVHSEVSSAAGSRLGHGDALDGEDNDDAGHPSATIGDRIAQACLECYRSLPPRGKPSVRSNGQPEWTVLAGICVVEEGEATHSRALPSITVVSLG